MKQVHGETNSLFPAFARYHYFTEQVAIFMVY